jgi:hypothetical protein
MRLATREDPVKNKTPHGYRNHWLEADSVRAMASRVLTGTFAAQDCASIRKEVTEILVLGLAVGVCAKEAGPTRVKSVANDP